MRAGALALLFVAVAILVRLPYLLGGHVAIDGDESVVALMARDLAAGKGVPVFWYGQRYGLALFEILPLAAAFRTFGEAPIVVKAVMLALWLASGVFTVWAAQRFWGARAAAVAGLALATLPAWIGWSTKARGGYLTALLATQIAIALVAALRERRLRGESEDAARAVLLGAALAVAGFGQPLFALPALPFLLLLRPRTWALAAAGLVPVAAALFGVDRGEVIVWEPAFFGPPELAAVAALPARLATALSGVFYETEAGSPPAGVVWAGRFFAALLALAAAAALALRGGGRAAAPLRAAAGGALLALVAAVFLREEQFAYRYLLPVATPLALLLGGLAARVSARPGGARAAVAGAALVCAIGASVAWADRRVSWVVPPGEDTANEAAATRALLAHLGARGIAHVYVADPTYQWNLIFESGGAVQARWIYPVDRIPAIPRAVDTALREGRPVALIAHARAAPALRDALARSGLALRLDVVADRHVVLEAPPEPLLRALGFAFEDGATQSPRPPSP